MGVLTGYFALFDDFTEDSIEGNTGDLRNFTSKDLIYYKECTIKLKKNPVA